MKKAFLNILGFIFMVFAVSGLMVTVLYVFVYFWERDSNGYSQHNNSQNINNQNINNQINLALDYAYGKNFDDRKAIELFNAAAAQGSLDAKMKLADYYFKTKRFDLAVSEYEELVSENHAHAKLALGSCYFYGLGVDKNLNKAIALFEEASDQGVATAKTALAICYLEGMVLLIALLNVMVIC